MTEDELRREHAELKAFIEVTGRTLDAARERFRMLDALVNPPREMTHTPTVAKQFAIGT